MSGSLATLAPDCLADLLQYINGDDFISLMMTGDQLLRHKLRQNCSSLLFAEVPAIRFPFEALRLHNLRSLAIHAINEAPSYLDFRNGNRSALSVGHKTLEKIDLRFRNAIALFLPSSSSVPRTILRNRFPSLITLTLLDCAVGEDKESLFGELPDTLTSFCLSSQYETSYQPKIGLQSITKLPKNLKTLKLGAFMLTDPEEADFKFWRDLFPPFLENLELSYIPLPTIMDYWPSALKKLTAEFTENAADFRWKASKIPPAIIELNIQMLDWVLELDVPLPSTLEIFITPDEREEKYAMAIEDMPLGLKNLQTNVMLTTEARYPHESGEFSRKSIFERFKNIETIDLYHGDDVSWLPSGIKFLNCIDPIPISSALPSSLVELHICYPIRSEFLMHLPSTLRSLTVGSSDHQVYNQNFRHQFPPWNIDDAAQLTSKVRLETFNIEMKFFESNACLAPLSKMESLKNFKLGRIGYNDMLASPQWLPKCLPRYLKDLHLVYSEYPLSWQTEAHPKISDDFLRLCNLAEVSPHLKSLRVLCDYLGWVDLGPSFASLPHKLIILNFSSHRAILSPDAVSLLPRSLRNLSLWSTNYLANAIIFNKHLEGLPEQIQTLKFHFGRSASIDENVFSILPKSIIELSGFVSIPQKVVKGFLERNMRNVMPEA